MPAYVFKSVRGLEVYNMAQRFQKVNDLDRAHSAKDDNMGIQKKCAKFCLNRTPLRHLSSDVQLQH